MLIRVERVTDDKLMNRAFGATVGKDVSIREYEALKSEHSPIRCLLYWVEFHDIPQRVVNHLTRHKAGVEWFVKTSRPDRVNQQSDLRDMCCLINAQALISISRKRLCSKAWHETLDVWKAVGAEMESVDPAMFRAMVPDCEYRGQCHELVSCGRHAESSCGYRHMDTAPRDGTCIVLHTEDGDIEGRSVLDEPVNYDVDYKPRVWICHGGSVMYEDEDCRLLGWRDVNRRSMPCAQ